jgi:glycosyltransferase involved in cell wall biosynthesis
MTAVRAIELPLAAERQRSLRIAIVTDAWRPQVNGVVRTLTETKRQLEAAGHTVEMIAPERFTTFPCPTYPEIRLSLAGAKSVGRLIDAFAVIANAEPELQLVLAGKPHPSETPRLQARVRGLRLQERVQFRPYVPAGELPELLAGALAFVYPSLWEGFGLPVLEAMAAGTPVLTSLGSGTEEVAGDAALLVDPGDQAALAAALRDLVRQPQLRQELRHKGLERVRLFSWERTAQATRDVLGEILSALA